LLPTPNTAEANLELDKIGDWASVLKADNKVTLELTETLKVQGPVRSHNMVASAEGYLTSTGIWTTIYDEGYEVHLDDVKTSFFAFNRYRKLTGQEAEEQATNCKEQHGCHKGYKSLCDQTFIGWYRQDHANGTYGFGCWFGVKQNEDVAQKDRKLLANEVAQVDTMLRVGGPEESVDLHHTLSGAVRSAKKADRRVGNQVEHRTKSDKQVAAVGPNGEIILSKQTEEKTPEELENERKRLESLPRRTCNLDKDTELQGLYAQLPAQHDWLTSLGRKVLIPGGVPDQGKCGSCYSVSSIQAFEMRIRIKLHQLKIKEPVALSAESVLACSYYNQACAGGFEALVYRHAMEFGIPDEKCMPYESGSGTTAKCKAKCFQDSSKLWYTESYGAVGGAEWGCSETRMMADILDHGPLSVGIRVSRAAMAYQQEMLTFGINNREKKAFGVGISKDVHMEISAKPAGWNAHDYHIRHAADGPAQVTHIEENSQGCSEFDHNDVKGAFVVVLHGGCTVKDKALQLQKAGARGVLATLDHGEHLYHATGDGPTIPTYTLSKADGGKLLAHLSTKKILSFKAAVHGWPILSGKAIEEEPGPLADALFVDFRAPPSVKDAVIKQLDDPFSPLWKGELGGYLSHRQNPYEGGLVVNGSRIQDWLVFKAKMQKVLASLVPGTEINEVHVMNATVLGFNTWEYIDHAVTVTGWGQKEKKKNEGTPFWVVMNSWGSSYGDHGFFYVRRGDNDLGIEADPVWARPDSCRGKLNKILKRNLDAEGFRT